MNSLMIYKNNMNDNVIELLDKINNIGELLNVLQCLYKKSLEEWVLKEKIKNRSSLCVNIPQPNELIELSFKLGLIEQDQLLIKLSDIGKHIVESGNKFPDRFNYLQGKIILPILLDNIEIKNSFEKIFYLFIKSFKKDEFRINLNKKIEKKEIILIRILQQLHFVTYEKPFIKIYQNNLSLLKDFLGSQKKISEKELQIILKKQKERSILAEKFVVEFEKKRLRNEGKSKLAELVERISDKDVGAGYDVISFDSDGKKRLIEVKSSTGVKLKFEWNPTEKEKSILCKKQYWIYFIPCSTTLPKLKIKPILIQDPISHLGKDLEEYPSNWMIKSK